MSKYIPPIIKFSIRTWKMKSQNKQKINMKEMG